MTDQEWHEKLSEEEYRILREKGTEPPHSGKYNTHFEDGKYHCKGCGALLFDSTSKFESNCGWPSFDSSVEGAIEYKKDSSFGMMRVEILCSNCGGHIGHIFDDGPTETGKRYCVNSLSINFKNQDS
ncbi:peptide-methionine (R)-S-oxide reductase MsrB [Psychroflexus tropicus]|uniref:peptide-methionine (R)-S-oxide reductase MsrB n=1 Tax=Psychroflexus tropicus TaxID=197345 RepID=UPI000362BEA9|nr:peptide-methionine (R)-S-oxide reductase MsrB [Psychroflexus tropicus]